MVFLGILGIIYILANPPTAEINNYQKQSTPKPYLNKNNHDNGSAAAKNAASSDAISLTGKKGRYDEHLIGGSKK